MPMFKKGDFVRVTKKIRTLDYWKPPRYNLEGRVGIIVRSYNDYPSVQFYVGPLYIKDPPTPALCNYLLMT